MELSKLNGGAKRVKRASEATPAQERSGRGDRLNLLDCYVTL